MVYTFDEAITVTSATATADNVISNKLVVHLQDDGVAGGFITDVGGTFSMATDGSSGVMVTEQQLQHVMAVHGGTYLKVDLQMVQLQYSVLLLRRQVLMLIH